MTAGTDDLDRVVLKRLFDRACKYLTVPLASVPSFLSYISSDEFLHHHDARTLNRVTGYLDRPSVYSRSDYLDLHVFTVWRHVTHALDQRSESKIYGLPHLVASALWHPGDRHSYTATGILGNTRHQFRIRTPSRDVVRTLVDRVETQTVPSVWELIAVQSSLEIFAFLDLAERLSVTLCTISRSMDCRDLLDLFFKPITFTSLMGIFYVVERIAPDTSPYCELRQAVLPLCGHIMELAPSWWIEGMNGLAQDDSSLVHDLPLGVRVAVETLRHYALDLTSRALRRGPCYDCPLSVAPLAFAASLRDYTVNPFAIYPIVDVDIDTYE